MKIQIAILLLGVAVFSGCVTKERAEADSRAAFFAGQASAMGQMRLQTATPGAPAPANSAVVTILGPVKNRTVPWTEDLTLVRALVAAEYIGSTELFSISVARGGKEIPVSPQRLLNGSIDPILEAGDVISLR